MKNKLNVLTLFAGYGSDAITFEKMGVPITHEAVENEENAVKAYNAAHNTNFKVEDVLTYKPKKDHYDLLWASPPCQAFSQAGKGLGAEDERGAPLWEATLRIIKEANPSVVITENVKPITYKQHEELRNYYVEGLNALGYTTEIVVLNTKDFGIPQNRERAFFISVKDYPYTDRINNIKQKLNDLKGPSLPLGNFLGVGENNLEHTHVKPFGGSMKSYNYYLSKTGKHNSGLCRVNKLSMYSSTISTLETREKIGYVKDNNIFYRPLKLEEKAELMGVPEKHHKAMLEVISKRELSIRYGNSVTTNIIEAIFSVVLFDNKRRNNDK